MTDGSRTLLPHYASLQGDESTRGVIDRRGHITVTATATVGYGYVEPSICLGFLSGDWALRNEMQFTRADSRALRMALVNAEKAVEEAEYIRKLNEHTAKAVQA